MQTTHLLNRAPLELIFVGLFVTMAATWIAGRWIGVRDRARCDEDARSHASGMHAALLGLLALLLGFTFSMAAQRFETNRDLVAEEASAIETAYLRTDVAAEPERLAMKDAIRRYVDTRVAFYEAKNDLKRRAAIVAESRQLQDVLWRHAVVTAARAPSSVTALLLDGVNTVLHVYELRLHAVRNHVPRLIMWLLVFMSAAATGLTGYVAGFGNKRHPALTGLVLALIAFVILVIIDLDRPMRGLIHGGQEAMLDLRDMLHAPLAPSR